MCIFPYLCSTVVKELLLCGGDLRSKSERTTKKLPRTNVFFTSRFRNRVATDAGISQSRLASLFKGVSAAVVNSYSNSKIIPAVTAAYHLLQRVQVGAMIM